MSPLYELICKKCSHKIEYHFFTLEWEKEVRMHNIQCIKCGCKEWEKLVSNIAFGKLKKHFHND